MSKHGKKFEAASKQVEQRPYTLNDAVPLVQKVKFAKFDETVELHMRLGVDPKHADQMVRGTVVLPNGLGKSKKVLVIASGDKQREATEAGADFVGGEDMVAKIQARRLDRFRRRDRHAGHDALGRQARQGARSARPDAQSEDRHGDYRCRQGGAGSEGRQSGVSRRQDRRHSRAGRQSEFRDRQAARKRRQPDPGGGQGQARRGQRQVRQERDHLLHHGAGRPSGRDVVQREGRSDPCEEIHHEEEIGQRKRSRSAAARSSRRRRTSS